MDIGIYTLYARHDWEVFGMNTRHVEIVHRDACRLCQIGVPCESKIPIPELSGFPGVSCPQYSFLLQCRIGRLYKSVEEK